MEKTLHLICLMLFCCCGVLRASTVVIDQPTIAGLGDYSPSGFGQSFTANASYEITAIDLYVSASVGGSDATLSLYDYDSSTSSLGSSIIGDGTFFESGLSASAEWIRVNLSSPVLVESGNEYAFVIVANDPGGVATGWNNYGFSSSDLYLEGSSITGGGSQGSNDLAFAVVATDATGVVTDSTVGVDIVVTGSLIELAWEAEPGVGYAVEWTIDLSSWNRVIVGGVGSWQETKSGTQRFYRVIRL